jgi:hypothetical protein
MLNSWLSKHYFRARKALSFSATLKVRRCKMLTPGVFCCSQFLHLLLCWNTGQINFQKTGTNAALIRYTEPKYYAIQFKIRKTSGPGLIAKRRELDGVTLIPSYKDPNYSWTKIRSSYGGAYSELTVQWEWRAMRGGSFKSTIIILISTGKRAFNLQYKDTSRFSVNKPIVNHECHNEYREHWPERHLTWWR